MTFEGGEERGKSLAHQSEVNFSSNSWTSPLSLVLITASVPPDQQCKLSGCSRRRFTERFGYTHDFCGKRHAMEYEKQNSKLIQHSADLLTEVLCIVL